METIKVASSSRTAAVAGAIAGVVRDHHGAVVQAVGAGAVNQALKALILATGYLKSDGIFISFVPEFAEISIDGHDRTAVRFVIKPSVTSDFSTIRFPARSELIDTLQ